MKSMCRNWHPVKICRPKKRYKSPRRGGGRIGSACLIWCVSAVTRFIVAGRSSANTSPRSNVASAAPSRRAVRWSTAKSATSTTGRSFTGRCPPRTPTGSRFTRSLVTRCGASHIPASGRTQARGQSQGAATPRRTRGKNQVINCSSTLH